MKGFVFGVLLASLGWGGAFYWQWQRWQTEAETPVEDEVKPDDGEARGKRRRRRRRRRPRTAAQGASDDMAGEDMPEPIALSAADKRIVARGDSLSKPDVLELDMGDGQETRQLTQDEIDEPFRAQQGEILSCIDQARPDDITFVPGRVTVHFRIQRTGRVRGVKVEAPAILHKGGIYECIKGVVSGLRFPPSGGSQVVSYPYQLS